MNLKLQYNKISKLFSNIHSDGNKFSNQEFFKRLPVLHGAPKLLDVGCGDGTDLLMYKSLGFHVYGTDSSKKLLALAQEKISDPYVKYGSFSNIPFENATFDVVTSKYALQTSSEIDSFYKESSRVLISNGELLLLVVHPLRQFFEKKSDYKNYFDQTMVSSVLFGGSVIVQEPTHTLQDYLTKTFFEEFELIEFFEKEDFYSAEKIGEYNYPTYLIIKAKKK